MASCQASADTRAGAQSLSRQVLAIQQRLLSAGKALIPWRGGKRIYRLHPGGENTSIRSRTDVRGRHARILHMFVSVFLHTPKWSRRRKLMQHTHGVLPWGTTVGALCDACCCCCYCCCCWLLLLLLAAAAAAQTISEGAYNKVWW